MSILLIVVVVLFSLETVMLVNSTKRVVFSNKRTNLMNEAETIAASLNSNSVLSGNLAQEVINVLGINDTESVLITDEDGIVLYSSDTAGVPVGICALYPEIISALQGKDTFRSVLDNEIFKSYAAMPIVTSGEVVGAVFLMEYDYEQAAVLGTIRHYITNLTLVFLGIGILVYFVFAILTIRKNSKILHSISIVQEGDYTHRIEVNGRDEFAVLASAFNSMTERLERNEQLRRQFVSDASHELRTPLAAIRLLADSIIQYDMNPETLKEFLGDISGEADRLTRMTSKLLGLSALDSRQFEKQELVPVNIGESCKKAVRMLTPLGAEHNCVIEESTEDDCFVLANEDDIFQLVLNLTENGIKYSGEDGKVRLIAYTKEEFCYLIVEDNGIGIPESELDRIFERFYRVDKARSRAAGGTGLGLSIVHDTVEKYNGSVTASNRQQGGARFTVSFAAYRLENEL